MANATGFRVGFAVGDADRISALVKAKEEMDSGVPLPFQRGLAALLDSYQGPNPPDVIIKSREVYHYRKQRLTWALEHLGFQVFRSPATFYIWFKVNTEEMGFIENALRQGILLTPGSAFGPGGRGWVRASVTAPDEAIDAAIRILIGESPPPQNLRE